MSQILKLIHKLAWTVGCQNPKFQNFYQNSLEIARAEVKVNGKPLHLPVEPKKALQVFFVHLFWW